MIQLRQFAAVAITIGLMVFPAYAADELDYPFIKEAWEKSMRVREFLSLQEEVGKLCGTSVTSAFEKWKTENAAALTHFARVRKGMEAGIAKSAPAGESPDSVFKIYDDMIAKSVREGVARLSGLSETQRVAGCQRWGELLVQPGSPIREKIHDQLGYFAQHEAQIRKNFQVPD